MNVIPSNGNTTNEVNPSQYQFTKQYDLNELQAFFVGSNMNESVGFGSYETTLTLNDVNQQFPVESVSSGSYSVYHVRQGGCFYVFWVEPVNADADLSVYFTAYLSSDKSPAVFDSLTPGVSTAEDVKRIDPSFELSFLRSSGIFSYSYINDETVMQIEYTSRENMDGYEDLIVKEKMLVARESVPSRYSSLLSSDTPS